MILSHIAHYYCLNKLHHKAIYDSAFTIFHDWFNDVEDCVTFNKLEDGTLTSAGQTNDSLLTQPKILDLFDTAAIKKPIRNALGSPGVYTETAGLINSGSQIETWLEVTPPGASRLTHRNTSGIYLQALDARQPITSFIYFIAGDEGNDKFYFYENDIKTYVDIKENMLLMFRPHIKYGMEFNNSKRSRYFLNGNVRLLNTFLDGVYSNWDRRPTRLIAYDDKIDSNGSVILV